MSDKEKPPIEQELAVAARQILPKLGGKPCKSDDDLAPGELGHIIAVQPVTRRKKRERSNNGVEEFIETSVTGLPIVRWFVKFQNPRSVLGFVHEMERRFPSYGFFVQDRRKFPVMARDNYPNLNETLINEIGRVKGVAVRADRTQLHGCRYIAQISCGYPSESEGQKPTIIAENMLFAFPSIESVKEFITSFKSIFDQKAILTVELIQTPNLVPIEQQNRAGGGGGGGMWKNFKIWGAGGGNAQEMPYRAAG